MAAEKREIDDWRDDVWQQLAALHNSLNSRGLVSDVPVYVLETLSTKVEELLSSRLDAETVRGVLRGAFRASADAGRGDDDDAVIRQLLRIYDSLPPEQ